MSRAPVDHDPPFNIDRLLDQYPKARQGFEWGRAIIELGARIKQARKAAGLSQQALADRLATNQAYISELERGTGAQGPTYMMLLKIADACATTVQRLIGASAPQTGELVGVHIEMRYQWLPSEVQLKLGNILSSERSEVLEGLLEKVPKNEAELRALSSQHGLRKEEG